MAERFRIYVIILMIIQGVTGCVTPERYMTPDRWPVFQKKDFQEDLLQEEVADNHSGTPLPGETKIPDEKPLALSVEKAVVSALSNNRELRVRQLDPVIEGRFEQIERGIYDPELFAEIEAAREKDTDTDSRTGETVVVEDRTDTARAGIRQKLPSGTDLDVVIEHERNDSDTDPEEEKIRYGISITQALLRGFGPEVNLASVRQAALGTEISRYELRRFTETLIAQVETAYWQYVLAREQIAIVERSLAVTRQQKKDIEVQINVGVLAEIDAAVIRAEVARREQALIEAKSLLEERRLRLVRLISPEANGGLSLQIEAVSPPRITPEPVTDLNDRLMLAQKSRPDLNEARLRLRREELETITTKNGLLPKLDFFAALGNTGFSDSFLDSVKDLSSDNYDLTVGLRLSHYLNNRAAKARYDAAADSAKQAALAVANLEELIALDVHLAVNEVERARLQITASETTRRYQEKTLYAEKQRLEVGKSTALLVAQAQRDLLAARINEVEAVISYRIALIGLYLAEGSLPERRGIRLN